MTCSPSFDNLEETKSTIRFGVRAKRIKNKAKINREWTVPELLKLWKNSKKQVEILKTKLKSIKSGNRLTVLDIDDDIIEEKLEENELEVETLEPEKFYTTN